MNVPRNIKEALGDPSWKSVVLKKMNALKMSGTWEFLEMVVLPRGKKIVRRK